MPLPALAIAGIASAVGSVIGGVVSSASARHSQKESQRNAQEMSLEQMSVQNQYNIDAFNRENEYNTPANQLQRMREAGLNPMWQGISTPIADQNSNVAASPPSGQSVGMDLSGLQNIGSVVAELSNAEQQKRELDIKEKYQDWYIDEQTKNYRSQRMLNYEQQHFVIAQRETIDWLREPLVAGQILENCLKSKEYDIKDEEYEQLKKMNPKLLSLIGEQILDYQSQRWYRQQQISNQKKSIYLQGQEIKLHYAELSELIRHHVSTEQYERFANYALGEMHYAQSSYYGSLKSGQDIQNRINKLQEVIFRNAKREGIPQEMFRARLDALRKVVQLNEKQIDLISANIDQIEQNMLFMPLDKAFDYLSGMGIKTPEINDYIETNSSGSTERSSKVDGVRIKTRNSSDKHHVRKIKH